MTKKEERCYGCGKPMKHTSDKKCGGCGEYVCNWCVTTLNHYGPKQPESHNTIAAKIRRAVREAYWAGYNVCGATESEVNYDPDQAIALRTNIERKYGVRL